MRQTKSVSALKDVVAGYKSGTETTEPTDQDKHFASQRYRRDGVLCFRKFRVHILQKSSFLIFKKLQQHILVDTVFIANLIVIKYGDQLLMNKLEIVLFNIVQIAVIKLSPITVI